MKNYIVNILIASSILIYSCQKEINDIVKPKPSYAEIQIPVSDGETYSPTILGNQLNNPFHIDTMQHAFNNLMICNHELSATHKYIKFLPSNIWQYMALLKDSNLILYDYPFDYEIVELGDFYQEPNYSLEDFTWLYTVVPMNKVLPDSIYTVTISELFLPEDSIITVCDSILLTDNLLEEAFDLCGYNYGIVPSLKKFKVTAKTKYYPSGYIKVQNTQLGNNEPIINAKVKCRYWFNLQHTYSNSNGYFKIRKGYKGKVTLNIEFQNSNCAIRGFRNYRVWEIANAVDVPIGVFSNSNMENISFTLWNTVSYTNEKKRRWMCAHACNSVAYYRTLASNNNISQPPKHLNIWLTNEILPNNTASACLLKQIGNTSIVSAVVDIWICNIANPSSILCKRILTQFLPDITIGYNHSNFNFNDRVSSFFFHELAHTSHYQNVGNNFWLAYINYIILHNGYGNSSSNNNDRVIVSEGWADYIENVFVDFKYGTSISIPWNRYTQRLEAYNAFPNLYPFTSGGFYYDLTEVGEPLFTNITDNTDAYTISQIFNALQSNITTMTGFKSNILSQNSNKQQSDVDILFSDYNF
jgi:hypothetical protein